MIPALFAVNHRLNAFPQVHNRVPVERDGAHPPLFPAPQFSDRDDSAAVPGWW